MRIRVEEKPSVIVTRHYGCDLCAFESREEWEVKAHTAETHLVKTQTVANETFVYFDDEEIWKLYMKTAHRAGVNKGTWTGVGWYHEELGSEYDQCGEIGTWEYTHIREYLPELAEKVQEVQKKLDAVKEAFVGP